MKDLLTTKFQAVRLLMGTLILSGLLCPSGSLAAVKFPDGSVTKIVAPLLTKSVSGDIISIQWNYRGFIIDERYPYYNRYLPRVYAYNGHLGEYVEKAQRAASGCLNNTLAQIFYKHEHPTVSVDQERAFRVWDIKPFVVLGERIRLSVPRCATLLRGVPSDPADTTEPKTFVGPYDWSLMLPAPVDHDEEKGNVGKFSPDPARDEMARLLHDVSVAMESEYTLDAEKAVTGSQAHKAPKVLKDVFHYANAAFYGDSMLWQLIWSFSSRGDLYHLDDAIAPSLLFGMPVALGLAKTGETMRHFIAVDGLGYVEHEGERRIVYHLNVGEGDITQDGWYLIDGERVLGYKPVEVLYNIFPDVTGELVAGRAWTVSGDERYLVDGVENDLAVEASLMHDPSKTTVVSVDQNGHYVVRYPGEWPDDPDRTKLSWYSYVHGYTWRPLRGVMRLSLKSTDRTLFHGDRLVTIPMTFFSPGVLGSLMSGNDRPVNVWGADFHLDTSIVLSTGADTKGVKEVLHPSLGERDEETDLNQSFVAAFGNRLDTIWDGSGTDALFVDTFPYQDFLSMGAGRFPWINRLIDKAQRVAEEGGIVYVVGEAWPFAQRLAARAGGMLPILAKGSVRHRYPDVVSMELKGRLREATGLDTATAIFTPDETAPLMDLATLRGARILATSDIVVMTGSAPSIGATIERFPMAVEFDLGEGKVIYSSFTFDPNLSSNARPEMKAVLRELVSEPLRQAQEKRAARVASAGQTHASSARRSSGLGSVQKDSFASMERRFAVSRDFEVQCSSPGDVTFVIQATDQTLGLDLPAEPWNELDVSLFAPDGELFERKRVRGTRASFLVSADVSETPEDLIGTWRMRLHETAGVTPHQLIVAFCMDGLHEIDPGDPGHDPRDAFAHLNIISGDAGANVLVGASCPTSTDVFIGGGGGDTYVGGRYEDVYVWEPGGGDIIVVNDASRSAPHGTLWIGEGEEPLLPSVERIGDDLVITLTDAAGARRGSVTVRGWWASPGGKLAAVVFDGGPTLGPDEIEAWASLDREGTSGGDAPADGGEDDATGDEGGSTPGSDDDAPIGGDVPAPGGEAGDIPTGADGQTSPAPVARLGRVELVVTSDGSGATVLTLRLWLSDGTSARGLDVWWWLVRDDADTIAFARVATYAEVYGPFEGRTDEEGELTIDLGEMRRAAEIPAGAYGVLCVERTDDEPSIDMARRIPGTVTIASEASAGDEGGCHVGVGGAAMIMLACACAMLRRRA